MSGIAVSPKVTVVGSINMDLVLRCAQLPKPGETISVQSYSEVPGGKGANQAVSASRAGANVSMIGRVGDDAFADQLIEELEASGVDCSSVLRTSDCPSGLAVIGVEDEGQNAIMFVGGANTRLCPSDIKSLSHVVESSDVILLQLEIPHETVMEAISIANAAGVRVILDPAPAPEFVSEELLQVDLICPNEHEASHISGLPVNDMQQIAAAAKAIYERGPRHVVITLGGGGAYLYDSDGGRLIEPFETKVKDTTAAGDAFIGALAVHWAEGNELAESVRFGNAAGSIAASREGAQPSMGRRSEIENIIGALT
ncbi:ribokinase [Calycomorphotria hydatis]|uniref:Ribokinase n=1 Tax=Calycomorphotria hydatis TaxID=2528027 RepID=A0A517T640_9PLAN|nr:ribokinase [Calycomorphotria hydatis]QDT63828.1 Ribokinase [Calycomorphotria hydatis]